MTLNIQRNEKIFAKGMFSNKAVVSSFNKNPFNFGLRTNRLNSMHKEETDGFLRVGLMASLAKRNI